MNTSLPKLLKVARYTDLILVPEMREYIGEALNQPSSFHTLPIDNESFKSYIYPVIVQFDVREMRVKEYLDKVLLNLREGLEPENMGQVYDVVTSYVQVNELLGKSNLCLRDSLSFLNP